MLWFDCGKLTLAFLFWLHGIQIAPERDSCCFFLSSQSLANRYKNEYMNTSHICIILTNQRHHKHDDIFVNHNLQYNLFKVAPESIHLN